MHVATAKAFTSAGKVAQDGVWYVGAGALANGTAAINVAYPTGVRQGDFCLLVVEAGGESTVTTAPSGWTEIDVGHTDVATTAGSLLRVFYQFFPTAYAYNGTGATPTVSVADHGDHTMGVILAWRNVNQTTPFDAGSLWSSSSSAVSSVTFPAVTTVSSSAKIICIATRPNDATTANFGTITPGTLTQATERIDTGSTQGHGGGLYVMEGNAGSIGNIGTVSVAKTTATTHVSRTIALRPA